MSQPQHCDLCGLEIKGPPIVRTFDGADKRFCCQGCARVYEVAHTNGMLPQVLPATQPGFADMTALRLDTGPKQSALFSLKGMWCAGCAVAAEQVLRHQPGVRDASVSFAAEGGRLEYDPRQVDPKQLLASLDDLGYRARLLSDDDTQGAEKVQERVLVQLVVALAFGMQVMLLYLVQLYPLYAAGRFSDPMLIGLQYLVWGLATPVLVVGGSSFFRGAWRALRARTATMDTLVALGTLAAYGYSVYVTLSASGEAYFDSVAMITVFVMLGRYLETLGGAEARRDIRNLLQLQPRVAHQRTEQGWEDVPAAHLALSDIVMVRPGERAPADLEIIEGQGAVDQSLLTGESSPIDKSVGDLLYAGSILTDATMTARVMAQPGDSRLAQITRLVEETLAAKSPIQKLADRASAYFALGILAVSALTAVAHWAIGQPASQAVLSAVAVLVVACPCALGLATPLAMAVSLGQAARRGIVLRNAAAIEIVALVRRVVFDKTGTLTLGQMAVKDVRPLSSGSSAELLRVAAAVEQFSEHPIARAIVASAEPPLPAAAQFHTLRGLGAHAQVGDERVLVGSSAFVGVDNPGLASEAEALQQRGETVVWVRSGNDVLGLISLTDPPQATAQSALIALRELGLVTALLSGDSAPTTETVARTLGIAEYEGNCPPETKGERIRAWQRAGDRVAMIGDGVNDAPALAQADVSITVAGGTDVAGETSDVLLTRQDLHLMPDLIRLARKTRRIIIENLGWAFAYNLVSVPLAALGLLSPAIAAAAMATSSLLVVGNSLRLRR